MSRFSKTRGGINPWSMPSDGLPTHVCSMTQKTKHWERQQYIRGERREASKEINQAIKETSDDDSL